jgi:uncharacterized membrane protein YcaP (DUF421 family)
MDQGDVMRAERLSIDDMLAAARQDGIGRFADIRLAVLEANGQIAFYTEGSGNATVSRRSGRPSAEPPMSR